MPSSLFILAFDDREDFLFFCLIVGALCDALNFDLSAAKGVVGNIHDGWIRLKILELPCRFLCHECEAIGIEFKSSND